VAAGLARGLGEPLRLVHVCEDARAAALLGTAEEPALGDVRARLACEAERLRARAGVEVHEQLAAEPVADVLTAAATTELASAVVVGGRTRLLARVPERLAARSPVPVVAIRRPRAWRAWLEGERPLRILVGADLGRAAVAARAFAARLATLGPTETEVVLVTSARDAHARLALAPPAGEEPAPEARWALLRELARAAPPDEAAHLAVRIGEQAPAAELSAHADVGAFDLVVVGRRERPDGEPLWRRSVARGVLSDAPSDVACVPVPLGQPDAFFRPPRTVVVGVALDEADPPALAHAIGYAGEGGAVHVAHVLEPASDSGAAWEEAWRRLSKQLAQLSAPPSLSLEPHVLEGAAVEELLGLAERVGADLIVAGARNRPALSRAFAGSVAKALVAASPRPILLVPPRRP
jgi:nucleotide-binding universal stress UspA family protein